MTDYGKDKTLKLAAATVTAIFAVGLGGALIVESALGLIILVSLEAVLLIGAGIVLNRMSKDKGH
ncbi:hypothetical protein H0X09_03575 [Candidatus Saccharibacteria bacterium]|nr:hypothetical protein [Candidatus Saccharibacteria bacterium]